MKLRIGTLFAFLLLVGFGPAADACEKCVPAGYNGWVMCSSGYSSGSQYCYGGFGAPCTIGGDCSDGGGKPREPEYADYSVACPTCVAEEPDQGFVLRTDAGHQGPPAERAGLD